MYQVSRISHVSSVIFKKISLHNQCFLCVIQDIFLNPQVTEIFVIYKLHCLAFHIYIYNTPRFHLFTSFCSGNKKIYTYKTET